MVRATECRTVGFRGIPHSGGPYGSSASDRLSALDDRILALPTSAARQQCLGGEPVLRGLFGPGDRSGCPFVVQFDALGRRFGQVSPDFGMGMVDGSDLQRLSLVPGGHCRGLRPPCAGRDALPLGHLPMVAGSGLDSWTGLVRFFLRPWNEQPPPDDLVIGPAGIGHDSASAGLFGGGVALLGRLGGLGLLGVRISFAGASHLALFGPFSLERGSGFRALDGNPPEAGSLADRVARFGGRGGRTFSLRLHASFLDDQPPDELGLHQHQGGIFLLGQPKPVLGETV